MLRIGNVCCSCCLPWKTSARKSLHAASEHVFGAARRLLPRHTNRCQARSNSAPRHTHDLAHRPTRPPLPQSAGEVQRQGAAAHHAMQVGDLTGGHAVHSSWADPLKRPLQLLQRQVTLPQQSQDVRFELSPVVCGQPACLTNPSSVLFHIPYY
jgi:hypothetical protein